MIVKRKRAQRSGSSLLGMPCLPVVVMTGV
jgi:hypothetical protein